MRTNGGGSGGSSGVGTLPNEEAMGLFEGENKPDDEENGFSNSKNVEGGSLVQDPLAQTKRWKRI